MLTMAQKRRKQLIKEARPLVKEWLRKKKSTPPDGILRSGSGESYIWNVPGLTAQNNPVALTEKGTLCLRLHVTRYTLFKGRLKSSGVESMVFELTNENVDHDAIENLIIALRLDLTA